MLPARPPRVSGAALTGPTAMATYLQVALVVLVAAVLEPSLGAAVALACGALVLLFADPLRRLAARAARRSPESEAERSLRLVAELDEQLEAVAHPDDLAVALVTALQDGVPLGYVSVSVAGADGRLERLYSSGERPAVEQELEVRHGGERVGVVGIGDPGGAIEPSRRAVVEAVLSHAGVALAALRLRRALDEEELRLDTARGDERRRLSADLHDRVGPALAGLKIGLSTQRRAGASGGVPLTVLADQAREVASDLRGVLDDEAPGAVAPGGLGAAVERLGGRLAADGHLTIAVRSQELGPLPARVEQAAFTIVAEALHNVVRHADATSCTVSIARAGDDLHVLVDDDGLGLPEDGAMGVGLRSMQRRAAAEHGTVELEWRPEGGTRLHVQLAVGGQSP